MSTEPEYAVKIPIASPIIIDGEAFGDFEGWALSHPDDADLMTVCLRKGDDVGAQLSDPFLGRERTPLLQAAADALWQAARRADAKGALQAAFSERFPPGARRRWAKADAYWNAGKEL
jgi:hypothetical protein